MFKRAILDHNRFCKAVKGIQDVTLVMGVSMQSEDLTSTSTVLQYQYGESLYAFARWIVDLNQKQKENPRLPRIKSFILVETGHLHRHNLKVQYQISEKEAATIAQSLGKRWTEQHQVELQKILATEGVHCVIQHWQDWLKEDIFLNTIQKMAEEYSWGKSELKTLVDNIADKYVIRVQSRQELSKEACEQFRKASIEYLIEEVASACIFVSLGAHLMVYPGACNPVFAYVVNRFFSEKPLSFLSYKLKDMIKN